MSNSLRSKKVATKVENSKKVEVKPVEKKAEEVKVTPEVKEVPVVEVSKVQVKEEAKPASQPNVRINPNRDLRTYIGNQWYNLKKGVQISVPKQVKDILAKSGMLDAL